MFNVFLAVLASWFLHGAGSRRLSCVGSHPCALLSVMRLSLDSTIKACPMSLKVSDGLPAVRIDLVERGAQVGLRSVGFSDIVRMQPTRPGRRRLRHGAAAPMLVKASEDACKCKHPIRGRFGQVCSVVHRRQTWTCTSALSRSLLLRVHPGTPSCPTAVRSIDMGNWLQKTLGK